MTPSDRVDATTGILTVTLGAVSGSFSPADFQAWGTTFMGLSPFVLVLFLIWRIRQLDAQHKECTTNHMKTQEQLALAFRAIQHPHIRDKLPSENDFKLGNFSLNDHLQEEH